MYAKEADALARNGENEAAAKMYERAAAAIARRTRARRLICSCPGASVCSASTPDRAGGFRRFNRDIVPGKTLVLGAPQGSRRVLKYATNWS